MRIGPSRTSVPATERPFTHIPPAHLYLDTNIILDHLISTRPHHARAAALFVHLAQHALTTLHICSLSWMEFVHVISRQDFRDSLDASWQQQYQLDRWAQPHVRQTYLQALLALMKDLLDQYGWEEMAVTPAVRTRALAHVMTYNLDAQDAVHLASAEAAGVMALASFDRGFRRIDHLYLWNDLIYGTVVP